VVLFQPFTIPSASMEPNLYEGDYIVVSKWSYGYSKHSIPFSPPVFNGRIMLPGVSEEPRRGDIVVFKPPERVVKLNFDLDPSVPWIKRVVALPGERVAIERGRLYVNGRPLPEPYLEENAQYSMREKPVPAGSVFVLGDNRNHSIDSAVWGPLPLKNIIGRASFRFWPLGRFGDLGLPRAAVALAPQS
jgi:signal peptidase I